MMTINDKWFAYYKSKDIDLRNELIVDNIQLAKKTAEIMSRKFFTADPSIILSHSYIGLIHAVEQYNPTLGYTFSTYASKRLSGAIIDGLRKEGTLSRSKNEEGEHIYSTESIESNIVGFLEYVDKHSKNDLEENFMKEEDIRMLDSALNTLSEKDKQLILSYHIEGLSYPQVSQKLGISISYIEKNRVRILEHLRKYLVKTYKLEGKDIAA